MAGGQGGRALSIAGAVWPCCQWLCLCLCSGALSGGVCVLSSRISFFFFS